MGNSKAAIIITSHVVIPSFIPFSSSDSGKLPKIDPKVYCIDYPKPYYTVVCMYMSPIAIMQYSIKIKIVIVLPVTAITILIRCRNRSNILRYIKPRVYIINIAIIFNNEKKVEFIS